MYASAIIGSVIIGSVHPRIFFLVRLSASVCLGSS